MEEVPLSQFQNQQLELLLGSKGLMAAGECCGKRSRAESGKPNNRTPPCPVASYGSGNHGLPTVDTGSGRWAVPKSHSADLPQTFL